LVAAKIYITMKLDLSSIVAGEYLVLGFVLVTVPDLFFNPVDGIFKAISPVRMTALESGHLDPITSIVANLIGGMLLTLAVCLLMADNPMKKNDMLHTCFYSHVFLTLVCGHAAVVQADGNPYLNLPMISVLTSHFFGYMLWFLIASVNEAHTDKMKRTPASWPRIANLLVMLTWAPAYIMNIAAPHYSDPGRTMALWRQTTLPDNTIDDLAVFHTRILGALGMSYVCSTIEALVFDRTNERLRWFSQCAVVGNGLCLVVLVRAALDTTGYVLNGAWASQSIVLAVFLLINLSDVIWPWDAHVVSQMSCAHGESVPGLVVVEDEKKVK
jgi:hypothetical protein